MSEGARTGHEAAVYCPPLPSSLPFSSRRAVFYDVHYFPVWWEKCYGQPCPQGIRQHFEHRYTFKIVTGRICDACKPIWVDGVPWEKQPEDKEKLRDHIEAIYSVDIIDFRTRIGIVEEHPITNPDAPEQVVSFWHGKHIAPLDLRILFMVENNLRFFRQETGQAPLLTHADALDAIISSARRYDCG